MLLSSIGHFLAHASPLWLAALAFWAWMLVDCIRREPDKATWLWVLILLNLPGALLYFILSYVPRLRVAPAPFVARWLRRRELWRAEAAARNIGNAHQFVELGDLLREAGRPDRAVEAYEQALGREPRNVQALWGAASAEMAARRFDRAKEHLDALLEADPAYKVGDAARTYANVLMGLGRLDAAKVYIEKHLSPRTDPEARILLATIVGQQGDHDTARGLLEPLVRDLRPARDPRSRALRKRAASLLRRHRK